MSATVETEVVTRESDTAAVLAYVKSNPVLLAECKRFEVIGAWVWVWFAGKPSDDCRAVMKSAGFHWNKTRSCWQHTGGRPSRHTNADAWYLRNKYGSTTIKASSDE